MKHASPVLGQEARGRVLTGSRVETTKFGAPYTPKETECEEREIARLYKGAKSSGPVRVTIRASSPLPKSRPNRVESEPLTIAPDIDNIAKAVLDALNEIAYDDDAQVVELHVYKHARTRGVGPCTRVEVEEL